MVSINERIKSGQINKGEAVNLPDEIPPQFGERKPTPVPGVYTLQIPDDFETDEITRDVNGKKVTRYNISFFKNPLIVCDEGTFNGSEVRTSVNNAERYFNNKLHPPDLYYMLVALGENPTKSWDNALYLKALAKHTGKRFKAFVSWRAYCHPDKNRRIIDADGNNVEDVGNKGCGASYKYSDLQNACFYADPGETESRWHYAITCECGARLNPQLNLGTFEKA